MNVFVVTCKIEDDCEVKAAFNNLECAVEYILNKYVTKNHEKIKLALLNKMYYIHKTKYFDLTYSIEKIPYYDSTNEY